jgi:hypothetical protein
MRALGLAVAASLACSAPATAGQPVLVELFTSQGCSSCPPAERFVRELPRRGLGPDKVVALAFHVDYWDHIGWADPFAAPAFTDRQTWYAQSGRLRAAGGPPEISGIYTPQMIVGGQVHFPGGQAEVAARQIAEAAARPATAVLSLDATVGPEVATLRVRVARTGALAPADDWRVTAALVQKAAETRVRRGENSGETLQETSVVRALSPRLPLPPSGAPELVLTLRKPPDLAWRNTALVAFVQSERSRAVAVVAEIDAPAR